MGSFSQENCYETLWQLRWPKRINCPCCRSGLSAHS
ncbi:MAG: hypothetical protein EKK71_08425 [Candidatus Competibacteraceae bacterium]|nr:MAG: hypothetical protein EKK71_08425 [Candidatus Competibacteraceae bacterium]